MCGGRGSFIRGLLLNESGEEYGRGCKVRDTGRGGVREGRGVNMAGEGVVGGDGGRGITVGILGGKK